jgi:hypothetical protein
VELAAEGNITAIKEITDRVEGKAPREIKVNHNNLRRRRWMKLVDKLSNKYDMPREQIIENLIEQEPTAAEWLM